METNYQLDLAWKFLEQTGTHIFLTGRAGTGKTTFLRNLKQCSPKRMIVVAPTGVAAINAAGVTIHSFFQIPFGPYLPAIYGEQGSRLKMNFSREKIAIIRSLDLLVIDEISMVRADVLDAINDVLQRYRDRSKPFGGVQLLMIGDLQQLAPVVKSDEWTLIHQYYNSPYFFDSKSLQATEYLTLELQHIYRQSDGEFIDILNHVRDNTMNHATLQKLNSRYIADFEPQESEGYITLTSHNDTARRINDRKMESINAKSYTFDSTVEGNFSEYLYPNDSSLTLKKGAQVMFVKNDISGKQRYFNGKIGQITDIDTSHIEVTLDNHNEPINVEIGEWTNTKYTIDPKTKEITESIEGVFRQFPLKAAWAITIHKSQGLTFERAIIDAAGSFSHGQVYVALSRCRSFEGLVLRTPLSGGAIINDATIQAFSRDKAHNQPDEQLLTAQSKLYYQSLLIELFNFMPLRTTLWVVIKVINEHLSKLYPKMTDTLNEMFTKFNDEISTMSEKFKNQINNLLASSSEPNDDMLRERIIKAQEYFMAKCEQIVVPTVSQCTVEVDNKEIRKSLNDALKKLRDVLAVKLALLAIDNSGGFSVHTYLETKAKATLNEPSTLHEPKTKTAKTPTESDSQDIQNQELFERLKVWRRQMAEHNNVPSYVVAHQKVLIAISQELPQTEADLLSIKGIGKAFITKYGGETLAIVDHWVNGK